MPQSTLGLYIHVPFCARKCAYCDFYSLPGGDKKRMDAYLNAVTAHMRESAAYTGRAATRSTGKRLGRKVSNGWTVDSVYIGGGTPTLLGAARLTALLKTVRKLWDVAQSAEITVEANPETVDLKMLKKLRRTGVNRVSFGVQAVQDSLLNTLGRIHSTEGAADAVRMAHAAGIDNVSVDLMYGLPGQTAEMLHESLRTVISWGIQHISVYGLKLEPNTPLFERRPALPDEEEQVSQYLATVDFLEREGFVQYEISNFAHAGHSSRHNMKYWTLEPYLGFGPAAHSDFGGRRFGYVRDLDAYIKGVRESDTVVDELQQVPMPERAGEYIMLGLRTAHGVSGNEYLRQFRVSFEPIEKKLENYQRHGYARSDGDRWRLTPKGFLVSNRILSDLLESDVTAVNS